VQLIWEEFLKIIKEEAGSQVVETWFKTVALEKWDPTNRAIYLLVPNQFVSKWLQDHYTGLIKTHLGRLLNTDQMTLFFTCNNQTIEIKRNIIPASVLQEKNQSLHKLIQPQNSEPQNKTNNTNTSLVTTKPELPAQIYETKKYNNLNENYTFESFIVGPSNSLAHAAGWAICQNIGKVYNPLFIYGGTGLGKTHLLHAIGNQVKRNNPSCIIRYETSDRFTNEFINSIRHDKIQYFRNKYQKIDLLLLDDIQFLSNKEQTQEMFFHIFNMLYEQEKQIILSSDTFPKDIGGLQNRLKSRLEWGLVVDIQIPDLETKIAILKKKAETNLIDLPDNVAQFIASRITSNIRELEGGLTRVGAFATLTNQPLSLELAKKVLLNFNEKKKEGIMLEHVLKVVAKHYSISIGDLKSKKRQKDISMVRQVAFYMMKKLTFCSLQVIGEFIGKRDHSTVLHAITKIESLLDSDKAFAQKISAIEQEILTS
jgi:chromosomal replication initiator protein